jgi:hypothetical protein
MSLKASEAWPEEPHDAVGRQRMLDHFSREHVAPSAIEGHYLSFRIFSDRTRLFGTLLSHARIGINAKDPEIIDTLMAYDFVAIAIMDLASAGTRPTRRKVTE